MKSLGERFPAVDLHLSAVLLSDCQFPWCTTDQIVSYCIGFEY